MLMLDKILSLIDRVVDAVRGADRWLLVVTVLLIVFGLAMISSVSVYESFKLSEKLGLDCADAAVNCNNFYLKRQSIHAMLGLVLMMICSMVPLSLWYTVSGPLFALGLCLLLLLFTPLGITLQGATGWLNIPGLPSIQPVELVKIALILYLARWLERRQEHVRSLSEGFFPYMIIVGLVVVLLALQPDFGSILVIVPTAFAIYFIAGASIRHLAISTAAVMSVALVLLSSVDHIRRRWEIFLNPEADETGLGAAWQVKQSLIAIGSGGWWGVGLGQSTQRFGFLPEVQGDTVFAAMAEELGLLRLVIFILGAYVLFAYRAYRIALDSNSRFGFLVAVGIGTWIIFQTLVNIGVNANLIPLTGITLPFISYGGSSLLALCVGVGILLGISRDKKGSVRKTHYR